MTVKSYLLYYSTLGLLLIVLHILPQKNFAQEFAHAGEYMEQMGSLYTQFNEDLWAYIKTSAHSKNARKIENKRKELINTTLSIQKRVQRFPAYENDASLRDSMKSYFKLCYHVLNEDYEKIVNLEAIAEDSYDLMEAYLTAKEKANEKLDQAGDRLSTQEEIFAANHNINLIEGEKSKTSQRLEAASGVIQYYNQLYLLFFKSYKQEAYVMDAVEKRNVNALIQNQNTLAKYASEGLDELSEKGDFQGDNTLQMAAKELLEFYYEEAKEKGPAFSNLFITQESFEKIKAAFDAKKPKDRTQADVDQYNQAVNAYNDAVNTYNANNEDLNKRREKLLDNWNKIVNKFMDRHVP